jgi:hypothetical protein
VQLGLKTPNNQKPGMPLKPYDFQLGPKETGAVEPDNVIGLPANGILPSIRMNEQITFSTPLIFFGISGKILYFDVFGDFHKQYYCAEVRPRLELLLQAPSRGSSSTRSPVIYHFEDCESFSRVEVVPGGPLMPTPWNQVSIKKEFEDSFRKSDSESLKKEYEDYARELERAERNDRRKQ